MSNVQGTNGAAATMEAVDTPMESPEKVGKGKGKMAEEIPAASDEEDDDEEEVSTAQPLRFPFRRAAQC